MKKGSIVSFVFSGILFVFGVGLIISSFRQALTPVSIQHFAEGFTMRLSINNLNLAITSISLMILLLGCSLFISSFLLLILGCYLNVSSKKITSDKIEKKDSEIIENNSTSSNDLELENSDVIEIKPKE